MPLTITAAHLDHRMRPSSRADALWARGVCHAWGVPLESGRAPEGLRTEAEARDARYGFLREVAERVDADHIVTAHHADDQAETVLFRILRGTGIPGLAGIPATTPDGLLRPLLPFWREEIEAYALENRIRWRTDPTNLKGDAVRNRIRNEILPLLEREVAPGARRNLVTLASLAAEVEGSMRDDVRAAFEDAVVQHAGSTWIDREAIRRMPQAVASRVVRKALRDFGIVPGRSGTSTLLKFITGAASGRELHLPEGVRIITEFDRVRLLRPEHPPQDIPLTIPRLTGSEKVGGELRIGGRTFRVRARSASGTAPSAAHENDVLWRARLRVRPDQFPVTLRGREPGDRIRTNAGTRPVRKVLIEERVPRTERAQRPVAVDVSGQVLWVAGARGAIRNTPGPAIPLEIEILDA